MYANDFIGEILVNTESQVDENSSNMYLMDRIVVCCKIKGDNRDKGSSDME